MIKISSSRKIESTHLIGKVLFFALVLNSTRLFCLDIPSRSKTEYMFVENKGQIHDQKYNSRPDVLFSGTTGNLLFHLKSDGISYQLTRVDDWKEKEDNILKQKIKTIQQATIYRVDVNWLNTNSASTIKKGNASVDYNNYYIEGCSNGVMNVHAYENVEYQNLYSGINLKWYHVKGQLKYDYIVMPGADHTQIKFQIKGAVIKLQPNGSILLKTPLGDIEEQAPIVFQNGKKLKAAYVLKNDTLSFSIENYDANKAMIIDPVVRLWGTYYGGAGNENCLTNALDASGNLYIAGYTTSNTTTLIATSGSHQSSFAGGVNDGYLVKFNSLGVRLWGTYYGGSNNEFLYSCATDNNGDVYACGHTNSSVGSAIATTGSHQDVFGGGSDDAFLVKFNSSGIRQWGTYYGGAGGDYAYSCRTDANANIYMSGYTTSNTGTVIATLGSHQASHAGSNDAFLVKFNSSGVRQWGTYYGTAGGDLGRHCAVDGSGNVYLCGTAASSTGTEIATPTSHQSSNGGGSDAFLVKFNGSGVRQWGTYYGGSGTEVGYSCAADQAGNSYLTGYTASNTGTVIASIGSHQTAYGGGAWDAFLVKFNGSGVRQWGTYYGGSLGDYGYYCTTDNVGNVFLTGETNSTNSISTVGSFQPSFGGGPWDSYLVKFSPAGQRYWGTYYGGNGDDYGFQCSYDGNRNVYLTGETNSTNTLAIATASAHQNSLGGGIMDGFTVKFEVCQILNPSASSNAPLCSGKTLSLTGTSASTLLLNYTWNGPNSFTANTQNPVISNIQTAGSGTYSLNLDDGNGCSESATLNVTVNSLPSVTATTSSSLICTGQTVALNASGAQSYSWSPAIPMSGIVSPTSTTAYTVIGTDANGCQNTFAITQSVSSCTGLNDESNATALLSIYPNPSNGVYTLQTSEYGSVKVYTSCGQLIYDSKLFAGKTTINLSEYANGIYTINFSSSSAQVWKKVVKQ